MTLNEGRDRSPGDTYAGGPSDRGAAMRSTKAGTVVPATPALRVGRRHRAEHRSTKAGTVVPATRAARAARTARWRATLNEGRDRSPGDTRTASSHTR